MSFELGYQGVVLAIVCPPHPEQTGRDWEDEVNAAMARVGPVSGGEGRIKVKTVAQDLLGKLPDAGKIYLEQMKYATICSSIRDDKTLSESEKRKQLTEYDLEIQKAKEHPSSGGAKPPASLPPPSKQPGKEKGSGLQSSLVERVHFAITKFEQTYTPWPMVGEPLGFNIYFKNVGNGMAYEADFQAMAALESDSSQYSQQRAIAEFEKWLQAQLKPRMSIPKDKELWASALGAIVTPEDVNNLLKGRKVMYLVGTIQFRDDFGKHTQRICHFLQPPVVTATGGHSELGIFQHCNQYNDEVAGWK
jgi:hypothetical protein